MFICDDSLHERVVGRVCSEGVEGSNIKRIRHPLPRARILIFSAGLIVGTLNDPKQCQLSSNLSAGGGGPLRIAQC